MFEQVITKIYDAEVIAEPWPHLAIDNIFVDYVYESILKHLPARHDMVTFNKYRSFYWLVKDGHRVSDVDFFWRIIQVQLLEPLRSCIEAKFGISGSHMGAELIHDVPGYSIGPHTDTTDKAVTGLFYLPGTAKYADQGTILYHSDTPDPNGKGHKFSDEYKPVKVVPYLPNSALFFKRSDVSFHGVRTTPVERWILAFDVFK